MNPEGFNGAGLIGPATPDWNLRGLEGLLTIGGKFEKNMSC